MRTKGMLSSIKDVCLLLQYLYMDEKNFIVYNNGLTDLRVRMTDSGSLLCKNLRFDNSPETVFYDTFTVPYAINVIEALKHEIPTQFQGFANRWEEIKTTTDINMTLNFY